jgi:hypothetical protein
VRYILTYTEDINGMIAKNENYITAASDTEATEQVKALLKDRDATDITLWRRGDFVILGREGI